MRCLNEWLARLANQEDGCKGRFWESRFKSLALLDETALLTAMAYVDLNPIRAGSAASVVDFDFTSVQQRTCEITKLEPSSEAPTPMLLPFEASSNPPDDVALPFNVQDYLDLVDTAGRIVRGDQRGAIADHEPKQLTLLGVAPGEWFTTVTQLQARFELSVGSPLRLRQLARQRGWRWVRGLAVGRFLCGRAIE